MNRAPTALVGIVSSTFPQDRQRVLIRSLPRWLPLAAAVVAGLGVVVTTRHGILFNPDSAGYLLQARRLAAGGASAWFEPVRVDLNDVTAHPPLYAGLLAVIGASPGSLGGARVVQVLATAVAMGLLTHLMVVGASVRAAVVGVVLLLVRRGSPLQVNSFLMSEAVFVALALLAIWALDRRNRPTTPAARRHAWLGLAAVAAAASVLTRLEGLAVVVGLVWWLWCDPASARRERVRSAAVLAIVAAGPAVVWLVRQAGSRRPPPRTGFVHWYDVDWSTLRRLPELVTEELLPSGVLDSPIRPVLDVASGVLVLVALAWSGHHVVRAWRERTTSPVPSTAAMCVTIWASLLFVLATRVWFDPFVEFEPRHLALVASLGVVVAVRRVDAWWSGLAGSEHMAVRRAVAASAAVALISGSVITARSLSRPDQAWFNAGWVADRSAVLAAARRLPADALLFSNDPGSIFLFARHDARQLPIDRDPLTERANPAFGSEIAAVRSALARAGGYVVLVQPETLWSLDAAELEELGFEVVTALDDGAVLRVRPGTTASLSR